MKLEQQFIEIRELIVRAKESSYKAVNKELIGLYWKIGEYISEKVSSSEWGKSVVSNLSNYLKRTEPNTNGFSSQNLWRMKQFFETYSKNEKLSPMVREISWTNNLIIIAKSKTEKITINPNTQPYNL